MTAPVEATTHEPGAPEPPVLPALQRVEWAPVPRVNLLPPEILERRRFRRLQLLLGLVVLLTLVAAAAGTWWASQAVADAQADLDAAQAEVASLQGKQARYAEVPRVTAEVKAATAARAEAMSTDVTWYRYLGQLNAALPTGVRMTNLTVTMTAAGTPATAPDPLTAAGIGTLSVDGTAPGYPSVSAWLDALDDVEGIDYPALTSAQTGTADTGGSSGTVAFRSAAVVTDKALSGLYEGKSG